MRRILSILSLLILYVFVNYFWFKQSKMPKNWLNLAMLCTIVLSTLILYTIIKAKRLNIANYWSFPKKHNLAYNFTISFFIILSIDFMEYLYNHLGMWMFVLLNSAILLDALAEEETTKQRKKEIEDYNRERMNDSKNI